MSALDEGGGGHGCVCWMWYRQSADRVRALDVLEAAASGCAEMASADVRTCECKVDVWCWVVRRSGPRCSRAVFPWLCMGWQAGVGCGPANATQPLLVQTTFEAREDPKPGSATGS